MMKKPTLFALFALFTLNACGADAPPTPPDGGITITGEARMGVTNNPAN